MSLVIMPVQGQNSPLPSHGVDAHQSSQQNNPIIDNGAEFDQHAASSEMPDAVAPEPPPNGNEFTDGTNGLSGSSQTNTPPLAVSGDNLTNAPDVQTNSVEINPMPDPNYKELPNQGASVHSEIEKPLPPTLLDGETNSPPGLQR